MNEDLGYSMDYDLWFRLARRYDFGYLPEYLACTRFYGETKTLGQEVEVHKEILGVVHRHHQSVPPSWVYGCSHAFLEKYLDRSKPLENSIFILGFILLSMEKFWTFNRLS